MFEVRSPTPEGVGDPPYYVETRRSSMKDAEQDVDLLKLFGKKAWIVDLNE